MSGKIQVQNALFNVGEFHVDSGKNEALKKLRKSEILVQSIWSHSSYFGLFMMKDAYTNFSLIWILFMYIGNNYSW